MDLSNFLARFFGFYLVIGGFFYLFRRQHLQKNAKEIIENEGFAILSGVLALIIGLLVVLSHNIWVWNWRVIITLIGYLSLLKGIIRMFIPTDKRKHWESRFLQNNGVIYSGFISLLIGVFLLYRGFS